MPDADFVLYQGDTASTLVRILRDEDGVPVNIAGAQITFRLVPLDGGVAIVNEPAVNEQDESNATGEVSYAWLAGDTDLPGWYDGFFVVSFLSGTLIQTYPNAGSIRILIFPSNAPSEHEYVTVEALKQTLGLAGTTYADDDIRKSVIAASRAIDGICHRRFYIPDLSNAEARYYTPDRWRVLRIDDLVSVETVAIDRSGADTFYEDWDRNVDYVLEPYNASLNDRPYEQLRMRASSRRILPRGVERSVQVVGFFGWESVPPEITEAAAILASRLVKRKREAPLGVFAIGLDSVAARIASSDPDVQALVKDYVRDRELVA